VVCVYSISEVSRRLHVHSQTLRNWERCGLLKPQRFGYMRVFSEYDIKQCEEIKKYSRRGVNLNRIRELLLHKRAVTETSGGGGEA